MQLKAGDRVKRMAHNIQEIIHTGSSESTRYRADVAQTWASGTVEGLWEMAAWFGTIEMAVVQWDNGDRFQVKSCILEPIEKI